MGRLELWRAHNAQEHPETVPPTPTLHDPPTVPSPSPKAISGSANPDEATQPSSLPSTVPGNVGADNYVCPQLVANAELVLALLEWVSQVQKHLLAEHNAGGCQSCSGGGDVA